MRELSREKMDQLLVVAALKADLNVVAKSLGLLAEALDTSDVVVDEATGAYGRKPIILIDEYDSPINSAATYGYYDEMVAFMRNFLSDASSNDLIDELVRDLPHDMADTIAALLRRECPRVAMAQELGPYSRIRERKDTLYASRLRR